MKQSEKLLLWSLGTGSCFGLFLYFSSGWYWFWCLSITFFVTLAVYSALLDQESKQAIIDRDHNKTGQKE
jgi:uncharacterized membrane protein